jgi:hypothetical protein
MTSNRLYIDVLKPSGNTNRYASYFKKYGQNIVDHANDYYLAVDRFNIPCDNIPLLIFDPTLNYYLVEMEYNGTFSGPITVPYIPSYPTASPADPKYYYVFGFDIMLKMINQAISTAFTALGALIGLPVGSVAPYFQINHDSLLIQYVAQSANYDTDLPLHINLYLNRNAYSFFYGIPIQYDASAVSRNAHILSYNQHNNIVGSTYVMTTNKGISTLTNWNVCKGIILASDFMPTEPEDLPYLQSQNSGLLNKRNILANFDFVYDLAHPMPDVAQYILNSVYKLIDLNGRNSIDTIDIKIYWYDIHNNIYNLDLNFTKALSIRFVFIKKGTPNQ